MKNRRLLPLLLLLLVAVAASAQRFMDKLDRGLIAMKSGSNIFVSWRIQADEYYGVTYNLYRNGTKIADNLAVSNYTVSGGSTSDSYQVAAVVNGVEQQKCAAVTPWANDYLKISPKHDASLTSTYIPNDACCADVDGDGQVEILMKYTNQEETAADFPKAGNNGEYTLFECLKLDGTVLWWVNCGPNMGDFQNNEQNIVGYDWDQDGKAEVVMRLVEGATIHMADGTVYTIYGADGKTWKNQRIPKTGGTEWFTYYGYERLLYVNGATGKPYVDMEYPLKRLEDGETDLGQAWGDGYGHRASKFFFGAPYLDGRNPSIFLGRGIYTRHKFIALDVDKNTHQLTTRWSWVNNSPGSPWYGQGYHNYAIVDVDWDGRDEIVWGSMVIDDNGLGLSTAGLGHGDAQHHGDLDPYRWGQEGFFCDESQPANNYRDLTTATILHRYADSNDDGRAIAGNFNNTWPGAMAFSAHENAISCTTADVMPGMSKTGVAMNFRCYWDGDLCEETFNGGDNTPGYIYKYGNSNAIKSFEGLTNNSTKATPCFMGDIFGDWREEFILRTTDNKIMIYSTTTPTQWRNYSLWYDHQYRNGMVWEMCGYNQPPHTSYFLGELEGITAAPPALTLQGRTEVSNGGTISHNASQVITCETNDMTVNVADGASPSVFIDNAPSWVQGWAASNTSAANTPSKIKYQYYTHTLTGGAFSGDMRLVKQGDGTLVLPKVVQTYTGNTDVWAGKLSFDGTMQSSRVWLNRHTSLYSDGGTFKTIKADYNATIYPGGVEAKASTISADSLILGFGSRLAIDIYSENFAADKIAVGVLSIENKVWPYGGGPAYSTPILSVTAHQAAGEEAIADGRYCIGSVTDKVVGNLSDIVIEGLSNQKATLSLEEGKLYLDVVNYKGEPLTWTGAESTNWNLDKDANFKNEAGEAAKFVTGSSVTFDDTATKFTVNVDGNPSPSQIIFNNTKAYTISGDSIVGGATILKTGSGTATINSTNRTGKTTISGGTLAVSSLAAKAVGNEYGSLGGVSQTITITDGARLKINASTTSEQPIVVGSGEAGAKIEVASGKTLTQTGRIARNSTASAAILTKLGAGTLVYPTTNAIQKLIISAGTVNTTESNAVNILPATVEFQGGTLSDTNSEGSYSTTSASFVVPAGKTGTIYCDPRCNYTGKLTGAGTLNLYASGVRCYFNGNWSEFEGELVAMTTKRGSYDPQFLWNNTYGLPKATLNVPNGYEFNNNGKAVKIKTLKSASTASGKLIGSGTYTIGEGYDGNISVYNYITSPLVYKGEEGRYLSISSTTAGRVTGALTVQSGGLRLAGTASLTTLMTGNNTITVTGTGTVYGTNHYINNLTATTGGTYSVTSNSDGATTGRTEGKITIGSGAVLDFVIASATSASKLSCASTLTLSSGAEVSVRVASGFVPTVGTTYTLWTAKTFSGTEDAIAVNTASLRAVGRTLDTSALCAANGVVKVLLIGDVDGDGVVTMGDANMVVNQYLGVSQEGFNKYAADMDGDGVITMADANAIVNLYLGM